MTPGTALPLATGGPLGDVDVPFVLAMALLSFGAAAVAGVVYRLVMDAESPLHFPVVAGVGTVGVWMNSAATIVEYVERTVAREPVLLQQMATNSAAVLGAAAAALLGAEFGDRTGSRLQGATGATSPATPIGTIVQAVGRFITVTVPDAEELDDIEGYEPVPAEAKEALGGATFRFPRGLTVEELHARVTDRIRDDYQVGHVDLEIDDSGGITHLAVGSRAAGLGPTLPPRKVATGLATTPAPGASPGDRVRVWRDADGGAERVGPAELRSTGDRVATVVMNERQVAAIDGSGPFHLVTLRSSGRPALEFASLLRAANESLGVVTVGPASVLDGLPVGALSVPVLAVRAHEEGMVPVPPNDAVLSAGDVVYAIGRHDELRRLRAAASV